MPGGAGTLVAKIWDRHVAARLPDGRDLLAIDRHLVHDMTSAQAFAGLAAAGRDVRHPELTFAVADHIVATDPGRGDETVPGGAELIGALRRNAERHGIRHFGARDPRQGIVHVVAPELGIALPGLTLVCGDSHTCTLGALGALAWGVGTSDVEHVLATQTLPMTRPKLMRVRIAGALAPGVFAKDLVLHLIGRIGAAGGTGFAVEYAGPAVRALGIEARMTLCNLSIEFGARIGVVAPDDVTFDYVAGRPYAPRDALWDRAMADWRSLATDADAVFDREVEIDAAAVGPQVTWGTSPEQVADIGAAVPDPAAEADPARRQAAERALAYMALAPGTRFTEIRVDRVFIGSCTNSRLSDLREAARLLGGRRVAPHVRALVVPGSQAVKRAAEAEGLDRIFREAGFEWRESGCSACCGLNADRVGPGERCLSTSNRNFEGRQGPGARTHLASPAVAAATAVAGHIADPRRLSKKRIGAP